MAESASLRDGARVVVVTPVQVASLTWTSALATYIAVITHRLVLICKAGITADANLGTIALYTTRRRALSVKISMSAAIKQMEKDTLVIPPLCALTPSEGTNALALQKRAANANSVSFSFCIGTVPKGFCI